MGKNKHLKVMGFSNNMGETEIHPTPKTYEKWISILQEKHRKTQAFQLHGFLKYFG